MPNFLLCNSKLTFQMTMTPEKTNYLTQGADGAKRLKQGPDLPSYRGLSIIHSRSFAMEAGQHPRDILRRRVRTAEYYRILPSPKNKDYEFEFYNEERDTWFSMSFQDLLRCAQHSESYNSDGGYGADNPNKINRAYNLAARPMGGPNGTEFVSLAAPLSVTEVAMIEQAKQYLSHSTKPAIWLNGSIVPRVICEVKGGGNRWQLHHTPFDMGITHIPPVPDQHPVWKEWTTLIDSREANLIQIGISTSDMKWSMNPAIRLTPKMRSDLFESLEAIPLTHPFKKTVADPRTPDWFSAYTYYQEVYRRFGFPMERLADLTPRVDSTYNASQIHRMVRMLQNIPDMKGKADISHMLLSVNGLNGSVNHVFNTASTNFNPGVFTSYTEYCAKSFILTYEVLHPLLREYTIDGIATSALDHLIAAHIPYDRIDELNTFLVRLMGARATLIERTISTTPMLIEIITKSMNGHNTHDDTATGGFYLGKNGISTWPMTYSTHSHPLHTINIEGILAGLDASFGHMSLGCLSEMKSSGPYKNPVDAKTVPPPVVVRSADPSAEWKNFWKSIKARMFDDPVHGKTYFTPTPAQATEELMAISMMPEIYNDISYMIGMAKKVSERTDPALTKIAPGGLAACRINLNDIFLPDTQAAAAVRTKRDDSLDNVEIVIVRPNIEHNMLGIVMGEGGSELGSTLWGQTELSCYDDSMHGLWGMSYKYHERAIVFNEKNLVRLWDISYDGYNGGKDDTFVDWTDPKAKNGHVAFGQHTLDIGKNYRGPSMMVMAFVHNKTARDEGGGVLFDTHFKRNWPSPIVFHDTHNPRREAAPANETLPLDYDNIQVVDVEDFRVFNNELYHNSYSHYKELMPPFQELHKMRKTAGHSSAESETQTDSLAFQGSMRIKLNGRVEQEIQGSGHHGADYIGVASVRAGKGLRFNGQAPTLAHMV